VDDIATMVAEAIARRIKAAQAQAQAQAQAANAATVNRQDVGSILARAAARSAGSGPPAVPPAAPTPQLAVPVPPPAAPAAALPALDEFAALPMSILDEAAVARPELLNSFSGAGLLSAIVLSEALGKPVALREGGPSRLF
jgi:hypothetical protein